MLYEVITKRSKSDDNAEVDRSRLFGIEASAQALWSERDQNFRLRTSQGKQFVLKIAIV